MTLPEIHAPVLNQPGIRHAFFTRQGGFSEGVYQSLNGGVGSRDSADAVLQNRTRMAEALGVGVERLVVPYQIHSAIAVPLEAPWADGDRPHADGLATRTPGLALGVTGADCGMVLLADPGAKVVGACHAGWRGALDDVPGATIRAMEACGADRRRIVAVLGPTIAQESYEVGPEFQERFTDADPGYGAFFKPSMTEDRSLFDLPAFIGMRCREAGIDRFEDLGLDTYTDETRFFSYRRKTHRNEADYGRLVAAIVIED